MSAEPATPGGGVADALPLGWLLSDEERLVQSTVRRFVERSVLPGIGEWFEAARFPLELVPELAKLGLFGMHLEGYGCAGVNAVSYGLACLELEAADSALRSFVSVQGSLVMYALHAFGSEEQKARLLPALAGGSMLGCFGLTEADSGSDPGAMRTAARRDGGDWVLDGSKMWITNGGVADVAVVWARTEEGVRAFLVERGTKGFSTNPITHKLSLRASVTSELVFEDCRLPAEAALPGVRGLSSALACLNEARFGVAWGAVGAARACFEAARGYALERRAFGQPIAAFQLTQQKLADMAIELAKSGLLALHLGRLKEAGGLLPYQVSMGKLNNVREALSIARTARTILGANGVTLEYPVIRHATNLESVLTYEGTSEIHSLVIGEALTGLPAFR